MSPGSREKSRSSSTCPAFGQLALSLVAVVSDEVMNVLLPIRELVGVRENAGAICSVGQPVLEVQYDEEKGAAGHRSNGGIRRGRILQQVPAERGEQRA